MALDESRSLTYTTSEIAKLLRISRGAAYQAIRRGEIPSLRFGRTIRIPRHALEELLNHISIVEDTG